MSRSSRGGFTLIELLVVITIIGMLMALLVPVAGSVRATMQRLQCANNQKEVGRAILQVVTQGTSGQFPGYRNVLKPNPNDGTKSFVGSWVIVVLPGLQQTQLNTQFRDGTPPAKIPYMEILVCPSDPPENNQAAALDYVVNCGKPDYVYSTDKAANGLFFDKAQTSGGQGKTINSNLNNIVDGAENTLMVSENMNLSRLLDPTTGWGETGQQGDNTKVTEARFGFMWWNDTKQKDGTPSPYRSINGGRLGDPSLPKPTAEDIARPASNHNGGVNVCFASGRETWLRQDIPYYVYQQLMTPDGNRADPIAKDDSGNAYNLADVDYKN